AKSGNDARPSPVQGLKPQDLDVENVPGLRAGDEDRSRKRIQLSEIDRPERRRRASRRDLIVCDFSRLAVDDVAGLNLDGRGNPLVPFVMDFALVEPVFASRHADIINAPKVLGTG